MNQLIPDLSYLHNDNSYTDFGDGYSLLRCRPEAMPHSLTTKMSMLTLRRLCRPISLDGPGRKENELMLGVILLRFGLNVKLRSKSQYYRNITNLIAIENIAYSLSFCGHRSLLSIQSNSQ